MVLKKFNFWYISSLFISLVVALPIITVFFGFFESTSDYFSLLKDTFLCFLILVVSIHWTIGQRYRVFLLFVCSILFYAFWRVEFVFLILVSVSIDYFLARSIYHSRDIQKKRVLLGISVCANLGLLFFFSEANAFTITKKTKLKSGYIVSGEIVWDKNKKII